MGRKSNGDQPIGSWVDSKTNARKKPINSDYLVDIEPLTENQRILFNCLHKSAYYLMVQQVLVRLLLPYIMLSDVLDESTPYEKLYIVRSLVATREIGFLLVIMKINLTYTKYHIKIW